MVRVRETSINFSSVILFGIILNFTLIILVKLFTNRLNELNSLQFIMAIGPIYINTFIILYPSICQATSRRILFLKWRLLASTSNFDDILIKPL